jgi:hypothetical protein
MEVPWNGRQTPKRRPPTCAELKRKMPFPKIHTCLVCEGIRQEIGGKQTLLGFYGVAPLVGIILKDLNIAAVFCFVFAAGEGSGDFEVHLRMTDPTGKECPSSLGSIRGKLASGIPVTNIFLGYQGKLSAYGLYKVAVIVDGHENYTTTINILPQSAEAARVT